MIRPKDSIFEHLCYALLIKRYQLQPKPIENDRQPEVLDDKLFEANYSTTDSYSDVLIPSSCKRLHYRKVELVLRYHVTKVNDPDSPIKMQNVLSNHDSLTKTIHIIRVMFCIFLQKTPRYQT